MENSVSTISLRLINQYLKKNAKPPNEFEHVRYTPINQFRRIAWLRGTALNDERIREKIYTPELWRAARETTRNPMNKRPSISSSQRNAVSI